ncbi:hypothetical protein B0H19DRAFT_1259305 [Mycena capillaripes]|nr:hypothetical protein B0H19DRAFT_1259305 [Mycena capillaripes]
MRPSPAHGPVAAGQSRSVVLAPLRAFSRATSQASAAARLTVAPAAAERCSLPCRPERGRATSARTSAALPLSLMQRFPRGRARGQGSWEARSIELRDRAMARSPDALRRADSALPPTTPPSTIEYRYLYMRGIIHFKYNLIELEMPATS